MEAHVTKDMEEDDEDDEYSDDEASSSVSDKKKAFVMKHVSTPKSNKRSLGSPPMTPSNNSEWSFSHFVHDEDDSDADELSSEDDDDDNVFGTSFLPPPQTTGGDSSDSDSQVRIVKKNKVREEVNF